MYEYRTTTAYGATLPDTLIPPEPGFRLRDFRAVTTGETETYNISDRYSSIPGPGGVMSSVSIPYATSSNRSCIVQWVLVWERYTEQEN